MMDQYIPIGQVARHLGVDYKTAISWLKDANVKLLQIRRAERTTTLVWKPDLDRFIADHTVKPEPKPEPKRRGRPPKLQLAKQG